MKKIVGDWSTIVKMTADEAKNICNLSKGSECCAFLVVSASGFECGRMDSQISMTIFDRLEKGTTNAKGEGGWKDCAWEGEI
jgi:hypothetical protein